jgi:Ala-tRNA(Pro) deacylase
MGLMNDTTYQVQLLIDEDVLKEEYLACHPCINTSSIKLETEELFHRFLPEVKHEAVIVRL